MASPHELALQSDIPPKTKSDSKWLRDMGYQGGLQEFSIVYGFKFHTEEDDARRLLAQFRDEQQEEWEALRRDKASSSASKKPMAEISESAEAKKRDLVQQAMLWHQRISHANYHSVLALPKTTTGVPSFEGLEVRDLPTCEVCTNMGMDPYNLDDY